MIASRKLDRLSTSAKLLQGQIKPGSPAELDHVQCNIRNEEQVHVYAINYGKVSKFLDTH